MVAQKISNYKWLLAALVVAFGNVIVYELTFIDTLNNEQLNGMVIGSLIDCAIVVPFLVLLHLKKWSLKKVVMFAAGGVILARVLIPSDLLEPFRYVTWTAFAIEGSLLAFEMLLLIVFAKSLPTIIRTVKQQEGDMLFSFPQQAKQYASNNPAIQVLVAEIVLFYYACFSWGKKRKKSGFTVYKNTMYVAVLVMIFHAAIFEAIAFHWYFHSRIPLLAWGHTILSLYGLLFLVADARALLLNPITLEGDKLYLSNGLMRRTVVYTGHIQAIHDTFEHEELYEMKVIGTTDEKPAFVLEMKQPQTIYLVGGFEKRVRYIGVYADDAKALRTQIEQQL